MKEIPTLDKIVASVSLDKILEKSVKMYKIPSLGISQRQLINVCLLKGLDLGNQSCIQSIFGVWARVKISRGVPYNRIRTLAFWAKLTSTCSALETL